MADAVAAFNTGRYKWLKNIRVSSIGKLRRFKILQISVKG